jgi:hypothetical protein
VKAAFDEVSNVVFVKIVEAGTGAGAKAVDKKRGREEGADATADPAAASAAEGGAWDCMHPCGLVCLAYFV